jgi:hypothetical protein
MRYIIVVSTLSAILMIAGCAGTGGGWNVIEQPTDPNYLFATGLGESQNMQVALDKASLAARTEIGRQLETKLNNLQKNFAEEVGDASPELNQMYTDVTKLVVSTLLTGSKIRESKYKKNKGRYEAVVLMEYPIGAANTALMEQIKKDQNLYTRFRASEGFKELEKEVEKYENWKKEQGLAK